VFSVPSVEFEADGCAGAAEGTTAGDTAGTVGGR
jgi:hypothetical protein